MTLSARQGQAIPQLRTAVMRLSRRLRQERHDDQLTPSQLAVLGNLMQDGPMTPGDLAAREHVRPPTMSRIVASLESGGWVTRQDHPSDRRQCLITVTDRAVDWVDTYRQARDRWLRTRLAEMTEDDRRTLMAAIPILEQLAEPSPR